MRPHLLVLARESRGLTQAQLARRLGISQGHLSRFEAGIVPVSDTIAPRIAAALEYPLEFFEAEEPVYGPGLSEFFHRRRSAVSSRALAQAHALVNIRTMHLSRLLRAADIDAQPLPSMYPEEYADGAADVARAVRAIWHAPRGPLSNLTGWVEGSGCVIVPTDFGTPHIDAISRAVPGLVPMIFVNPLAPGDRARLTLAHELGHLVMDHAPRPTSETDAFRFSAELLMPEADIRPELDPLNLDKLVALKRRWGVSMQAILRHAEQLHEITPQRARYLWKQLSRAGFRLREPAEADIPREEPTLLRDLFAIHQKALRYSVEDLASLLGSHADEMVALYPIETDVPSPRKLRLVPTGY